MAGIHIPTVVVSFKSLTGPVITSEGCRGWLGKMDFDRDGRPNPRFAGGPLYKYRNHLMRRSVLATRFAYAYATGVDPGEQDILHSCDHSWCVEASHMRLGTPAENTKDTLLRHRSRRGGEGSGNAVLTHAQRREIYKRAHSGLETQAVIAADYGIDQSLVSQIKRGVTGNHATGAERVRRP